MELTRESDLSAPVAAWLVARHLEHFAEVRGRTGPMPRFGGVGSDRLPYRFAVVDAIGRDRRTLVAVELKLSASLVVIEQAARHRWWASECWIAVASRPSKRSLARARERGVGVLRIAGGSATESLPAGPTEPVPALANWWRDRLSRWTAGGVGGVQAGGSSFDREAMIASVVALRRGRNPTPWKAVWQRVPSPYASHGAMRAFLRYVVAARLRDEAEPEPEF